MNIGTRISGVIALIFELALIGVVVTQVQNVSTANWTFTGYLGAIVLMLIIPFAFIAGIVIREVKRSL